jgi:hypothetical protein
MPIYGLVSWSLTGDWIRPKKSDSDSDSESDAESESDAYASTHFNSLPALTLVFEVRAGWFDFNNPTIMVDFYKEMFTLQRMLRPSDGSKPGPGYPPERRVKYCRFSKLLTLNLI